MIKINMEPKECQGGEWNSLNKLENSFKTITYTALKKSLNTQSSIAPSSK